MLIASTRLYDVAPAARAAWHAVLRHAWGVAGLEVTLVEHAWPTPVGELWSRPGLCGAFMCGWPFAVAMQQGRRFRAVAGVVPAWPAYEDQPRYRSEFLVRDDSPWRSLEEALGSRYGWMVQDSQSGWNAPRAMLADFVATRGPALFSESRGPLGNPRGLLEALQHNEIDITAIDGWYLDLMREHDAPALAGLRTLAYTPWTPNPLLVCSPDVAPETVARLAAALQATPADLLRAAFVGRFTTVDPAAYGATLAAADKAQRLGYPAIR